MYKCQNVGAIDFRANAILNVATFVLFRILLLGWMTRWLTVNRDEVPILFFTVGSLGLATIVGMNIVLFYRILVGDYLGSGKKSKLDDAIPDESSEAASDESDANCSVNKESNIIHRRPPQHQLHLPSDVSL